MVVAGWVCPATAGEYNAYHLGPGRLNAINNNGTVVGWYASYSIGYSMSWKSRQPEWEMFVLGGLGGDTSEAFDINDHDPEQIAGWAETATGQMHAFGWTEAEGMVDLAVSDEHESCALGINDAGTVVGWYAGYSCGFSMSWDGSEPTPLGTLGGLTSQAHDINNQGQIVGWGETDTGLVHAFGWTEADGMMDLMPTSEEESRAFAVNESGAVVGWYAGYSVGFAMAWDGSEPTPLGSLGGPASEALAINELSQVVGWGETESGSQHGFLWTESEGMVDLNDCLVEEVPYVLKVANDINDAGWIAVTAVDPDTDNEHALVLVPVSAGVPTNSVCGIVAVGVALVAAGTFLLRKRQWASK
jgi:probable HAF family extracellular repeat protein